MFVMGVIFISKKGFINVMIICTIIIVLGFTIVSIRLPEFIKNESDFKIYCTLAPFDFTVDVAQYSLCINDKLGYNFENGTKKLVNSIGETIHYGISVVSDKTKNVFENVEDEFTK